MLKFWRVALIKRRMVYICLCVVMVLFGVLPLQAQSNKISFSVSGGAGYLPLKDWKDFATSITPSHFEQEMFGSYMDLHITYHLSKRHAVAIDVENIKTSASLHSVEYIIEWNGSNTDTLGASSSVTDWDFRGTPIGLSYEFYPKSMDGSISPFLGAGASYLFSEVTRKQLYLYNPYQIIQFPKQTRTGQGYELHIYLGIISKLTDHLLVISRLMGRFSDGMAFTDKPGAIKVEFTGVDFTLGLGLRF